MTDIRPAADNNGKGDPARAASGDREALGRLFDRFYPDVLRYALRRMLVRAAAEDVTSAAFLQVARHVRTFHGTTLEDFRRWLFRIATNEVNASLRQTLRRKELLEEAVRLGLITVAASDITHERDGPVDWSEVYAAITELSERDQEFLSLRYFAGLQPRQIAEVLETSPGTVRTALSRALQSLRVRLRLATPSHVPDESSSG